MKQWTRLAIVAIGIGMMGCQGPSVVQATTLQTPKVFPPRFFEKPVQTLVLVIRPDCKFCQESLETHKALVELVRQGPETTRVLVAAPLRSSDDPDVLAAETTAYLQANDLKPDDGVIVFQPKNTPIKFVPTILLFDKTGHLMSLWQGSSKQGEAIQYWFDHQPSGVRRT